MVDDLEYSGDVDSEVLMCDQVAQPGNVRPWDLRCRATEAHRQDAVTAGVEVRPLLLPSNGRGVAAASHSLLDSAGNQPAIRGKRGNRATLTTSTHPDVSWPGVAVTVGAIVLMPLLARAKGTVAVQLGSPATAGDSAQSWLCAISAAAALLSILANAAFGSWWIDPVAALGIAGLAVREGGAAWAGEVCGDCAHVGFEPTRSRGGKDCC
jgi:hypothetical protein